MLQQPGGSDWSATATAFRGQNGTQVVFTCPSYGTTHTVWGTDIYTDDSSVCTAAVHAGRITLAGGGTVTIEIRPGESSYTGSTRNGITTSSYPAWPYSYVIVGAAPAAPGIGVGGATWEATATAFRPYTGARFRYTCPPNGTARTIWGTNVYTDDSSVCTAAVHTGRFSLAQGGSVTIEIRGPQTSFAGSTRNGITSQDYPAWPGSFIILGAAQEPPEGTATGTVLVNGQPFTAGPIPFGSTVDTTAGTITLRADVGTLTLRGDGTNTAMFIPSKATERVKKKTRTIVQLTLTGGDFAACPARTTSGRAQAPRQRVVRSLWGDGKGRFRTKGRYAAATVRGTTWQTVDRCDGTLTRVTRGAVDVRDLTRRRTVRVRAGQSYLAPSRRSR